MRLGEVLLSKQKTLFKRTQFLIGAGVFLASILASFTPFWLGSVYATPALEVAYDALPSVLPQTNYPSQPFQAQQTAEFGDSIHLGGINRVLNTVTVTMSDWAKYSDYSTNPTYSGNSSYWTHPITLNVYSTHLSASNTPDQKLATVTQNISIPWRPESDPTCAGTSNGTGWKVGDTCYNYSGLAFNTTFDLSSLDVSLPNDIIVTVAYNTQTWGYSPIGVAGPYNSLNVAVPPGQTVSVGSDNNIDATFWNTHTCSYYTDGGASGCNVLREDTNWTPYGTVALKVTTTQLPAPSLLSPANNSYLTNAGMLDWSDVTGATGYEYESSNSGATNPDGSLSSPIYHNNGLTASQINASGTAQGIYYWQVRAKFGDGSYSGWASPWKLTVDTTKPSVPSITAPTDDQYLNNTPILNKWDPANDNLSPIDHYQIAYNYDNGHSFGSSTCPGLAIPGYSGFIGCRDVNGTSRNHTPGINEQGGVTIWVRAIDKAGNVGDWSTPVHYYYDATSPDIPTTVLNANNTGASIPSGGITNSEYFTFHLSSSSDVTRYQLKYWNDIPGSYYQNHVWNPTNLSGYSIHPPQLGVYIDHFTQGEGTHYFAFSACDAAGNCSAYSAPFTVSLDNTAPDIQITAPAITLVRGTITISGTMTDNNPDHYYLVVEDTHGNVVAHTNANGSTNGVVYANYVADWSWNTKSVQDGTYTIDLEACDAADNKDAGSTATLQIVVDNSDPTVTLDSVPLLINGATTIDVTGSVNDTYQLDHYNLSLYPGSVDLSDGETHSSDRLSQSGSGGWGTHNVSGTTAPVSAVLDTSSLVSGQTYQIRLAVRDKAGNRGLDSFKVISFTFDNTAPDEPSPNVIAGTYTSAQTVTLTSNDITSGPVDIYYTTDGSIPSSSGGTLYAAPIAISSTTTLQAIAYDHAGNASTVLVATYTISQPQNTAVQGVSTINTSGGSGGVGPSSANSGLQNTGAGTTGTNPTEVKAESTTNDTLGQTSGTNTQNNKANKSSGLQWYWWLIIVLAAASAVYAVARRYFGKSDK